jgi:phosphoglycerate dehydrogenase-like enzyme
LSIHQKSSERTRGAINEEVLRALGPDGTLINTSRGPIVDEQALVRVLTDESLGGAGLDVFNTEPLPPDHPLRTLDNVVALPHVGYGCKGVRSTLAKAYRIHGEPRTTPTSLRAPSKTLRRSQGTAQF